MIVPDLAHMIQVEEIHASGDCINCGKAEQLHLLVWLQTDEIGDPGRIDHQCYPGLPFFYEAREVDEST